MIENGGVMGATTDAATCESMIKQSENEQIGRRASTSLVRLLFAIFTSSQSWLPSAVPITTRIQSIKGILTRGQRSSLCLTGEGGGEARVCVINARGPCSCDLYGPAGRRGHGQPPNRFPPLLGQYAMPMCFLLDPV